MRREAKEFRLKKPLNNPENKSDLVKSQEEKLPQTHNPKVIPPNQVSVHENGLKSFNYGVSPQPFFDVSKFQRDFEKGNVNAPPQVINFFLNSDINQLSAQFVSAFKEGRIENPAQHGKSKPKKQKSKVNEKQVKIKQEGLIENEGESGSKKLPRNGSRKNFKNYSRPASRKNSRDSSSSSRQSSKHRSSGKKYNKGKNRASSSRFKANKKSNLKADEAEVLFVNHSKSENRGSFRPGHRKSKQFRIYKGCMISSYVFVCILYFKVLILLNRPTCIDGVLLHSLLQSPSTPG
jgi:hypothetical protein